MSKHIKTPLGTALLLGCLSISLVLVSQWSGKLAAVAPQTQVAQVSGSTSTWVPCANEYGTCSFTGTTRVLFGVSPTSQNVIKTFTGSVYCDNSIFGDPAPGLSKSCLYESVVTTSTTDGTIGPTITSFTPSGPITLSSGQTVTGLSISNPNGPCISGSGVSNVHIYNNKIGPCAPDASGVGIDLWAVHDIRIDHNSFDDVAAGLYLQSSTNNIVFDHNYVTRVRGPNPRGEMVQFNEVNGSGNEISCNISDQPIPGYLGTGPEDHINMYASFGTAASPILIRYNKLHGGGPSQSGGGIVSGDGFTGNGGAYITVDTNILVDPGQYGVAIAGGHDIKLLNNKIYSSTHPWSNVGMFAWDQYNSSCHAIEVSGNKDNWTDRNGLAANWWNAGNCGTLTQSNNIWGDPAITASIWDETFPQCGTTPPPPPPPPTGWTACAAESGQCSFTGTHRVTYGVSLTSQNIIKTFTGGVTCNNTNFTDPAVGLSKSCWYENVTTSPPPPIVGDFNNDGLVNSIDLSLLTSYWNQSNTTYDLNHDGIVNSLDYVIMVQNWTL